MKLLLAAALAATAFPVAAVGATEEGRPEANASPERRHCTQITVRAGSRMSGRRVCRTPSEWRDALGADWRQLLAGYRGVEEDYESMMIRTSPVSGPIGQQGRSSRGGGGPR